MVTSATASSGCDMLFFLFGLVWFDIGRSGLVWFGLVRVFTCSICCVCLIVCRISSGGHDIATAVDESREMTEWVARNQADQ